MGIELGAISQIPSIVEKRVWVRKSSEEGSDNVQEILEEV
jgi:hypothetical protein